MESIEQPIFNPYASDDKDELIDDPSPRGGNHKSPENNNSSDTSPAQAAKGLLSSGKEALARQNRGLMIIIACTVIFAIIITIALILTIYLVPKQIGGQAAVVTEVGTCSDIGLDVLRRGGNAVDAAVAAAFCLGVVHPQSSGLGGGGFLLYHDHKNHKSVAYDFRETAPAKASANMLTGVPDVALSGLAVAVPGELKGLDEVHSEWGSTDWGVLIQPSIDLAHNGFNVTRNLAESLANHVPLEKLGPDSHLAFLDVFMPGGDFVQAGQILARPDYATTLKKVAERGSDVFYRGILGERFVEMVKDNDGVMEMSDLEGYTVQRKEPVKSTFKGNTVIGMPAPSSGPIVALMLKMMEGFNWTKTNTEAFHQMIETYKFGFGHRSLLGDPANMAFQNDILNATEHFLSGDFAAVLRASVDNVSHADASFYGPTLAPTLNKGTTHISVIDSNEVMVSLTLTNNYWFGTKLMTEDGILANNEMLDFSSPTSSLPPNPRNMIVPGMRPLSSMTPTIVVNTEHPCAKRVVLGASNGTRIITGVVESLVNAFIFNKDLKDSVASPRLHNQLFPARTEYEDVETPAGRVSFPQDVIEALKLKDHTMVRATEGLSCVQAVMKINDDVQAYSDWRKGGRAAMF